MPTVGAAVDLLQLIGEPTRLRLLALLARDELTVAEIVGVTQLAQSSVSTHLGKLREAGLVRDRKAGASTFYALNESSMPAAARKVWELMQGEVKDALLEGDGDRSQRVIRARERSGHGPDAAGGEMDLRWSPGRTWESLARAMVGLIRMGDVVDIGAGDGSVAHLIATRAHSLTCVDKNPRVVAAARERLSAAKHARFVVADAEDLPFEEGSFDVALMMHVLTQIELPGQAIAEAVRVLRPCGTLVVATLEAHSSPDATAVHGDLHAGFAVGSLRRLLVRSGLLVEICEVSCWDKRAPHIGVITAFATKARRLRGKS